MNTITIIYPDQSSPQILINTDSEETQKFLEAEANRILAEVCCHD